MQNFAWYLTILFLFTNVVRSPHIASRQLLTGVFLQFLPVENFVIRIRVVDEGNGGLVILVGEDGPDELKPWSDSSSRCHECESLEGVGDVLKTTAWALETNHIAWK